MVYLLFLYTQYEPIIRNKTIMSTSITIAQLHHVVRLHTAGDANTSATSILHLTGIPGAGKTSVLSSIVKELGYSLSVLTISTIGTIESAPVVHDAVDTDGEATQAVSLLPAIPVSIAKILFSPPKVGDKTIILIDEWQQLADRPDITIPIRQLLLEKCIDGLPIHPSIRFVLAGNMGKDSHHGLDFHEYTAPMLASNINCYNLELPRIQAWADTARSTFLPTLHEALWEVYTKEVVFHPTTITPRSMEAISDTLHTATNEDIPDAILRIYLESKLPEAPVIAHHIMKRYQHTAAPTVTTAKLDTIAQDILDCVYVSEVEVCIGGYTYSKEQLVTRMAECIDTHTGVFPDNSLSLDQSAWARIWNTLYDKDTLLLPGVAVNLRRIITAYKPIPPF